MAEKARHSNTAENIALTLSIIMMGVGSVGTVMLFGMTEVPFFRDAILPGAVVNMLIHLFAIFIGVGGIWLYKVSGALFLARIAIDDLSAECLRLAAGIKPDEEVHIDMRDPDHPWADDDNGGEE